MRVAQLDQRSPAIVRSGAHRQIDRINRNLLQADNGVEESSSVAARLGKRIHQRHSVGVEGDGIGAHLESIYTAFVAEGPLVLGIENPTEFLLSSHHIGSEPTSRIIPPGRVIPLAGAGGVRR